MTEQEIDQLWEYNMGVLNMIDTPAATLIKAVLVAAERNGPVYVRLNDPKLKQVRYEMVEGDQAVIKKCADALGAVYTEETLAARS